MSDRITGTWPITSRMKLNAIKRVRVVGEPQAVVARDIGVPESTFKTCIKKKLRNELWTSGFMAAKNINRMPTGNKRVRLEEPYYLSSKRQTARSMIEKERKRNRGRLETSGAELGMCHPEIWNSVVALEQLNSLRQSQIYNHRLQQHQQFVAFKMENGTLNNNNLVTMVGETDRMMGNLEQSPSFYESASYWQRHHFPAASRNTNYQPPLWNWHQHSPYAQLQLSSQQQLSKDAAGADEERKSQNDVLKEQIPKNRSVLDNRSVLTNVDACTTNKEDIDVRSLNRHEVLEHGEKFLDFLKNASHPSVTTLQVNMVENLIEHLKKATQKEENQLKVNLFNNK